MGWLDSWQQHLPAAQRYGLACATAPWLLHNRTAASLTPLFGRCSMLLLSTPVLDGQGELFSEAGTLASATPTQRQLLRQYLTHVNTTSLLVLDAAYEDADAEWTDTMVLRQLQGARKDGFARKPVVSEGSLLRTKIQELEGKLEALTRQGKSDDEHSPQPPPTLSNVALPRDTAGQKLITGELDILLHQGVYFLYSNNLGWCPGIDCCASPGGCATCCFEHPPAGYERGCGRGNVSRLPRSEGPVSVLRNSSDPWGFYHEVQVYRTADFRSFENLGVALSPSAHRWGCEYRPHVRWNPTTEQFIMWTASEGCGSGAPRGSLPAFTVFTSPTAAGPFRALAYNVTLPGKGGAGDFTLFVSGDGTTAYNIRTGYDIVRLNAAWTGPAETDAHVASVSIPGHEFSEAPVVFQRRGIYYLLGTLACCVCTGGSNLWVLTAPSMRGPWEFRGDIGSNPTRFDPHSPRNYVMNAQLSAAFRFPPQPSDDDAEGSTSTFVVGNQWNSGVNERPPGPRAHDLYYWTRLDFEEDGGIKQLQYSENCTLEALA